MKLSISKSGAFLCNGKCVSFIKGMKNVVNFINNNSGLSVSMEVVDAKAFDKIFTKINNVMPNTLNVELIKYSESFVITVFSFKTV